jgi:predicted esterase
LVASKYIENLILILKEKYNVNEVYLLGFSQGSIIDQIAGINNYRILSGIIILAGSEINYPGKTKIVWSVEENVR